jgi:hypothetical protein
MQHLGLDLKDPGRQYVHTSGNLPQGEIAYPAKQIDGHPLDIRMTPIQHLKQ